MNTKNCVAYYRVSTQKQGATGYGVEAQRTTVGQWSASRGYFVMKEFVETESGRKCNRPVLAEARKFAAQHGAVLVVAKLDRLARDVQFILDILKAKVPVAFCDFPDIPEGAAGELVLTIMASVAQFEARLISQRTRAALTAARARGVVLGNPNIREIARKYQASEKAKIDRAKVDRKAISARGLAVIRRRAVVFTQDAAVEIMLLRDEGITSLYALSSALNGKNVPAPRGGRWYSATVKRVQAAMSTAH